MRKISRTIAMILVLVMLASSFTGCLSYFLIVDRGLSPVFLVLTIPADIGLLIVVIMLAAITASGETGSQIYLANAGDYSFTEYYSLRDRLYSLPDAELAALRHALDAIPGTELNSAMERFTSLPEEKRISLIRTYNSLPEGEFITKIERINSTPETELVSLLQAFNSLSEEEFYSLLKEINSGTETKDVVVADELDAVAMVLVTP
jgi:hypothetical protein